MSALGSLVVSLALDYAQYTQGLDKSDQAALKFARNAQRSFDDAKASVQDFLKGTVASAAGAIGAMVALNESFNRSLEFNKSIAQISTQIDGSIADLNRLEAAAKSMSVQFGTLPVDQAKAFYEIISSGTEDITAATDLLAAANKLAIGGITDLATSVDGLTNIMNSYSGKVASAEAVSDALFVGMKAGKATMEEFSSGLGKVTPLASAMNVSFDELVATIAALSKQGISTQESITGVRAILASVAKPTKEARDMAESLGIEFNAAGLQAKGFAGFLEEITRSTGGNADALALLFGGVEALVPAMALAGQAGQDFNSIMAEMETKAGATQAAFEKMAASPGFKIDQLMASINSIAITLGDTLAGWLVPAAEAAAKAINNLFGLKQLSAIDQQKQLIASLREELASLNDRKNIPLIGDLIFDRRAADFLEQRIEDAVADLDKMEQAALSAAKAVEKESVALKKLDQALNPVSENRQKSVKVAREQISESQRFIDSLFKEAAQLGKTSAEIRKMEAAKLGVLDVTEPLIDHIEAETAAAQNLEAQLARVKSITEEVMTAEEKFAQTQRELNELLALPSGGLSIETYERALKKTEQQLFGVRDAGRDAFNELDQYAIQAARNIQSALADGLFRFFDDGLKGMVKGVGVALGRIVSEFASLKLLQGVGLGGMLGVGATGAMASSGAAGISAFNLASLGASTMNLFSTGLGATGAVGGALSAMGGSTALGSFGAGMVGGQSGAAFIAAESATAGAGAAAGMGASFASVAGPMIALAAVDMIGRFLAGNKSTGTFVDHVPVIGGFAGALFGRGPLKQRDTVLSGVLGAEGFESGSLRTNFRAKGGLFRSNKNDFVSIDALSGEITTDNSKLSGFAEGLSKAARDVIGLFNEASSSVSASLFAIADNMGLSTAGLESFNRQIRLVSENGQFLTEEQIAAEIAAITDALVNSLVPGIEQFAKRGETSVQTVQRINAEFESLNSVLQITGLNAAESRNALRNLSIEQRTALVDLAGGVDQLNQKSGFFFQNILTDADRLGILSSQLSEALREFGVEGTLTVQQLRELVVSNTLSAQELNAAFNLAPLIQEVDQLRNSASSAANAVRDLSAVQGAFAALDKSLQAERNKLTTDYNEQLKIQNDRIQDVNASINTLAALSNALKASTAQLRPLGLTGARHQLVAAIAQARAGNFPQAGDIQQALQTLANQSTGSFRSRTEFLRSQAQSAALIDELGGLVEGQLTIEERNLAALESARDQLTEGFEKEISRLDSILENARLQLDALNGIDGTILSVIDALGRFNNASASAGGGTVNAGIGNTSISAQMIRDFSATHTPDQIYQAAIQNGVTAAQIAASGAFSMSQIDAWLNSRGLPRFASGTSFVPRTGPAIVHQGERIINPRQNQDLIDLLRKLLEKASNNEAISKNLFDLLKNMTTDGTSLNTRAV